MLNRTQPNNVVSKDERTKQNKSKSKVCTDNSYFLNISVESWHYTSTTFVNGTCNTSGFPA